MAFYGVYNLQQAVVFIRNRKTSAVSNIYIRFATLAPELRNFGRYIKNQV